MRIQNTLLASLLAALYGCQPKTPAPEVAAPATVPPPVASTPAAPAATSEAATAPARQAVAAGKAAQPAAAGKMAQAAPAPAVAAPVAKTEPAAAELKAEAKEAPAVSEADAMQLAKKNNCLACHAIDKKVVGPAWKDVAVKYRSDAGAEAKLMDKIARGGSGVWGVMVMPPSPQVSEADRKALARFVLSLK